MEQTTTLPTKRKETTLLDEANPEALIKERCADHGDDPSRYIRAGAAKDLNDLTKSLDTMRNNPTLNSAQIEIDAAALVRKRAADRQTFIEVRRQSVERQQEALVGEIEEALQPPRAVWAAQAPEIRAMLRGLSDQERDRVLAVAEQTGEQLQLLYAIASAPAALSGVQPGTHMQMKSTVLAIRSPALLTRPAQLKQELALLARCEEGFHRSIAELVDFGRADALKVLAEPSA